MQELWLYTISFFTAIALALVGILIFLFAPQIMQIVAGNYGNDETSRLKFFSETIMQLRVMSPLILLSGINWYYIWCAECI